MKRDASARTLRCIIRYRAVVVLNGQTMVIALTILTPPTPNEFFISIVQFRMIFHDKLEEISFRAPVWGEPA
jgi:hypothetical protein